MLSADQAFWVYVHDLGQVRSVSPGPSEAPRLVQVNKDVRRMDIVAKPDGSSPDMEARADLCIFEASLVHAPVLGCGASFWLRLGRLPQAHGTL